MGLLFWAFFLVISTHYLGFPLFISVLAWLRPKEVKTAAEILPSMTLIVAAYNEAKVITEKCQNSLKLDYPPEKLEIIVVSDGSTDETPELVASFTPSGIVSLHAPERRGKTAALNRAAAAATGEILLFSDANSFYRSDVPKKLAAWFSNPKMGGVTGRKAILKEEERESAQGDSLFWDLESRIKTAESRLGSIPTGDGEIFAIRRSLYSPIEEDIINDDTAITLNIVRRGYRVGYESNALSEETASLTLEDDFRVKARMVSGGFQILSRYRDMLVPPRSFFAIQFLLHKTLRHLMPLLLMGILITNIGVAARGANLFFSYFLCLQLAFYFVAYLGYQLRKRGVSVKFLYLPVYYCYMNLAAVRGFYYFLKQTDGVSIWKKAER